MVRALTQKTGVRRYINVASIQAIIEVYVEVYGAPPLTGSIQIQTDTQLALCTQRLVAHVDRGSFCAWGKEVVAMDRFHCCVVGFALPKSLLPAHRKKNLPFLGGESLIFDAHYSRNRYRGCH